MPRTSAEAISLASYTRAMPESEGCLVPPEGLDDAAARVFAETVQSVRPGHFRPCDIPVLVEYCAAIVHARQAAELLARDGLLVDGKPHPAHRILRAERAALALLASRLRLTPASRRDGRTAMGSTDVPQTGPLAALAYLERKNV